MVVRGERLMAQPSTVLYRFSELILAYLHRWKFSGLSLCFLKTDKSRSIALIVSESGIDAHTDEVRGIGYYYRGNHNPMRQGG